MPKNYQPRVKLRTSEPVRVHDYQDLMKDTRTNHTPLQMDSMELELIHHFVMSLPHSYTIHL